MSGPFYILPLTPAAVIVLLVVVAVAAVFVDT